MVRGIFVFVRTERLVGAVDEEMMDEMTTAERGERIAVQQAMEPIAGELRDETRASDGEQQPPSGQHRESRQIWSYLLLTAH
jgi:hypothetical protein